jgi:hypothetical protein
LPEIIQRWCSLMVKAADFQSADGVFESSHRLSAKTFRESVKICCREFSF